MIEKFEANITQFGDDALLVRVKPKELKIKLSEYTLSLSEFLIRSEEFWVDIIPAEESLAVKFNPFEISAVNAHKKLEKIINAFNFEESIQRCPLIKVPVCYSKEFAPDLEYIAQEKSLTVDDVIEKHTGVIYEVIMIGFTPGFAYLGDLPKELTVPRLTKPRVNLVPGSVGIAGNRTGIYTLGGPGGWRIIGRTPLKLYNQKEKNPFIILPRMEVKFKPISRDEFDSF